MIIPREFYKSAVIARAANVSKRTVANWARKRRWPSRKVQNRWEFSPPLNLHGACQAALANLPTREERLAGKLEHLSPGAPLAWGLVREQAVLRLRILRRCGLSDAKAALQVIREFRRLMNCSPRSLARWNNLHLRFGFLALVDGRAGKSGRPQFAPVLPTAINN